MAPRAPKRKKLEAIELLANGGLSYVEICEKVGLNQVTLRKWRKDPEFCQMVLDRSRELLKEKLPDIYPVLAAEAKKGSHQHIKILLEHLERLETLRNTAELGQVTFTWRSRDE